MQDVKLRTGPLNYLFMHTGEAGAYCLGVFDNGGSGTLLGGISFRNILVQVIPSSARRHSMLLTLLHPHIRACDQVSRSVLALFLVTAR